MERKKRQQLKKNLLNVVKAAKTENTDKNGLLVLSR